MVTVNVITKGLAGGNRERKREEGRERNGLKTVLHVKSNHENFFEDL